MKAILLFLLLAACTSYEQVPMLGIVVADEEDNVPANPEDGKGLYLQNCSSCHNANGDGEGDLAKQLGIKARSFAQGGFAFGNTREAIFRTISAGMPGSSYMPPFRGKLTDEERWKIADFVISLTPQSKDAGHAEGSVLRVGDAPVVARGKLPSLADGLPERPRGLLIGLPEGLSFAYRVDDVRFLGAFLGDFADRTDWDGRGGSVLKPLGKAFYLLGGGDPVPVSMLDAAGAVTPLKARLKASAQRASAAWIEFELRTSDDGPAILATEFVRAEPLSAGMAFTRKMVFSSRKEKQRIRVPIAGMHRGARWESRDGWWVGSKEGAPVECVYPSPQGAMQCEADERGLHAVLYLVEGQPVELDVTVILLSSENAANLGDLAGELEK